ncbi:MAG: hypothetical protein GF349_04260 [Candidatus Magasanikbacteria bacterium]|nr:hypothetical protein [Candidatus Magasanikbacteria bacterium]
MVTRKMKSFIKIKNMRLSRRLSLMLPQKRFLLLGFVVFFSLVFIGSTTLVDSVSAEGSIFNVNVIVNGLIWLISSLLFTLSKLCLVFTVWFLKLFIWLAGYNGYIEAPAVILGWTMVRDVANMFFVVVLLVIAFGTILGIEQYEWKKTMVNFVLIAILINFSRLIAGIIIDAAHVFTMTFVNAISTTAGGNLINMFNLNAVSQMSGQEFSYQSISAQEDIRFEIFGAAVAALTFSVLAMGSMVAYAIVMMARMVILWVLIILSPIAYITSILQPTKDYAKDYWREFTKYVIAAPMMVFFLWLAFATLGSGESITNHIQNNTAPGVDINVDSASEQLNTRNSATLSSITRWENLASFFIALAFLWLGLDRVNSLGVKGGGFTQSVIGFGKKVGLVASGVAVGQWVARRGYEKGADLGKRGGREALRRVAGRPLQKAGYQFGVWGRKISRRRNAAATKLDEKVRSMREERWKAKQEGRPAPQYGFKERLKAGLGGLAARFVETGGRKDKKVEDYKKAYERMGDIVKHEYSTSKTRGGLLKQEFGGILEIVEARGKDKTSIKDARAFEYALDRDPILRESYLQTLDNSQAWKSRKNKIQKERQQEVRGGIKGREAVQRMARWSAEEKVTEREISRSESIMKAIETAAIYRRKGNLVKAEQVMNAAYQEIEEDESKEIKGLNIGEIRNLMVSTVGKLQAADFGTDEFRDRSREASRIITEAARRGHSVAEDVKLAGLSVLHPGEDIDLSQTEEGLHLLELLSGRKITDQNEFDQTTDAVDSSFATPGERHAVYAHISNTLWGEGETGGSNASAAISSTPDPSGEYASLYKIANPFAEGAETKAEQDSSSVVPFMKPKELPSLHGMVQVKMLWDENQGKHVKKVDGINNQQMQDIKNLLTQFADQREVAANFNSRFSGSNNPDNFTEQGLQDMAKMLTEVWKDYSDRGLKEVFVKLFKTQFAALAKSSTFNNAISGNVKNGINQAAKEPIF